MFVSKTIPRFLSPGTLDSSSVEAISYFFRRGVITISRYPELPALVEHDLPLSSLNHPLEPDLPADKFLTVFDNLKYEVGKSTIDFTLQSPLLLRQYSSTTEKQWYMQVRRAVFTTVEKNITPIEVLSLYIDHPFFRNDFAADLPNFTVMPNFHGSHPLRFLSVDSFVPIRPGEVQAKFADVMKERGFSIETIDCFSKTIHPHIRAAWYLPEVNYANRPDFEAPTDLHYSWGDEFVMLTDSHTLEIVRPTIL